MRHTLVVTRAVVLSDDVGQEICWYASVRVTRRTLCYELWSSMNWMVGSDPTFLIKLLATLLSAGSSIPHPEIAVMRMGLPP